MEGRNEAESMEEHPTASSVCFPIPPRATGWRGATHRKLGSLMAIIKQENAAQTYLQANLMESFSQRGSLFPGSSSLCLVNSKANQHND